MNVYDFDNTIFRGDSTVRFILFCLGRHPMLWTRLPGQIASGAAYLLGKKSKQRFKEGLFTALMPRLKNPEEEINAFWEKNLCRIKPFYAQTRREDDVVISASPEFLILPACQRLGIACAMASPVDAHTGAYRGENCHGAEKVRRFRQRFPHDNVDEFYSDSHSDDPMAAIARKAVLVNGEKLLPWKK